MKRSEKSLKITKIAVIILCCFFIFFLFTAPFIFKWYCELSDTRENVANVLIAVFYACSPSATITLVYLLKFIKGLEQGEVFTDSNVKYLKILSYACLSVVPLSIPLCFYFIAGLPIPAAAGFMWLFLRILKNAFEYGTIIKNENDLTV